MARDPRDDFSPIFVLGSVSVYAATALVALHSVAMLVVVLLGGVPAGLVFQSRDVLGGWAFWQFVTYAFLHPPSIWFVVEMYFLYTFGRELERFFGRRTFLKLYAILLLAPPCVLTAVGVFVPTVLAGSNALHLAVFIAFATLYPGVLFFFNFKAKWIALVFVGIALLQAMAARDGISALVLLTSVGIAYGFVRRLRNETLVPGFAFKFRAPAGKGTERKSTGKAPRKSARETAEVLDVLLDKISQHGFQSLSASERKQLENARAQLLERDRR